MRFTSALVRARLERRYKRFLADVVFDDGGRATVACPNTGSLLGLQAPGSVVWLSRSDAATRKYPHTWEMIEDDLGDGPTLVGINPMHPNRLVAEALANGAIEPLSGYETVRPEVKYGDEKSRIDFLLEDDAKGLCYVEVKNVHLMRASGHAEFPDCSTARGAKHLRELSAMVAQGHRAVMLYLIQRADAQRFSICSEFDPAYAEAFRTATAAGVEAVAYNCRLSTEEIVLDRLVPFMD
ncbi:DNA/RNA nuclease SfsA [Hyphomicrobium sp. D-2]|uniref:DNA/RNA nuclease SfsA n=1 Tax=Hyphomicrobium sp. D-2 TaxID=3041621 RepID=UPI0024571EA1|nr:DNA/RNA nuclease SfsA [Hyphomicrobium sp. D-2]MDH4982101.1 DNA/RNA nuclease SfsA [Hyphomicrobium sp. D-2]